MDRNSITGIIIITLILIGFYYINKPSEQQLEAVRVKQEQLKIEAEVKTKELLALQIVADSLAKVNAVAEVTEGSALQQTEKYGLITPFVDGVQQFQTLENELIKITFTLNALIR